jgi:hypothetical protein
MIADDVRRGLSGSPKKLPAYLFYDDLGSRLYEEITSLPEYYLTRVERSILDANADDVVRQARGASQAPLTIVELGAGSASKTELLLRAAVRRQGKCIYVSHRHIGRCSRSGDSPAPWGRRRLGDAPAVGHARACLRCDPAVAAAAARDVHR